MICVKNTNSQIHSTEGFLYLGRLHSVMNDPAINQVLIDEVEVGGGGDNMSDHSKGEKHSSAATDEEQDVSKRKRAKNWLPEEETVLVDGYMENKEELTCELKGASNIIGKIWLK